MELFDRLSEMGHEEIAMGSDPKSGYRGIVAIHSYLPCWETRY